MSKYPEITEVTSADFKSLARVEEPDCLSIFVPQAGGAEAALAHSAPALKYLLRRAGEALRARHVQLGEINQLIAPFKHILGSDMWHGTEQTFVAFSARGRIHSFFVPPRIGSRAVVGDRFFLKSLIPSLTRTRRYYVVAISDKAARLFYCSGAKCTELHSETIPTSLEQALGIRDVSFSLQGQAILPELTGRGPLSIKGTPRR